MAKAGKTNKTYKGAPTDVKKNRVSGGFSNSGQKHGHAGPKGKEKLSKLDPVQAKLRKVSKAMFGRTKAMNNDAAMRAQLNG